MDNLRVFPDAAAVCRAAAEEFVRAASEAIRVRGRFAAALSGGSTPRGLYALLADDGGPFKGRVDWSRVHFFWGDERCVPSDHPESNYRMARESMLEKLSPPTENVHRIPTELVDPEKIASSYEADLRRFFRPAAEEPPRFDLVLLGMGPDGHTASLFPHTEALGDRGRFVAANWVEKLRAHRVTLTLPVINNARSVLFLVAGGDKARALDAVLRGPRRPEALPAQAVRPVDGDLWWFVDRAASPAF